MAYLPPGDGWRPGRQRRISRAMRCAVSLVSIVVFTVIAAGCGGGGSHTYVLTPSAAGVVGARGAGIYLTMVSPHALPQSLFDAMRPKMTVVARSAGPEVCSYSERS